MWLACVPMHAILPFTLVTVMAWAPHANMSMVVKVTEGEHLACSVHVRALPEPDPVTEASVQAAPDHVYVGQPACDQKV